MGTTLRPELSKSNTYYLGRHRYYELKHFCAQYYEWKKLADAADSLSKITNELVVANTEHGDPTVKCSELREHYRYNMKLIEDAARDTDPIIGHYIFRHVTEGLSYEKLNAQEQIPTNKDYYYILYRKFFSILDLRRM